MIGYSDLLIEDDDMLLAERKQLLQRIIDSGHYMTSLIDELLDHALLDAGQAKLHRGHFPLQPFWLEIQAYLSILAEQKGLSFDIELSPDVPKRLYNDEARLRKVALNLIGNAIKYTPKGFVKVQVNRVESSYWSFQVRDSGPGIPIDQQNKIFDPFQRVSGETAPREKGSGLGLSIVKQIIDLMNGRIYLDSKLGEGSTFVVTIPLHDKG